MKNYIYKQWKAGQEEISNQIYLAKHKQARDVKYQEMKSKVLARTTKTFPKYLKEQLLSILDFVYMREVFNYFVYPVLWDGKLYLKWDNMPEECKEALRKADGEQALAMRPYPMHKHHFTEGRDAL